MATETSASSFWKLEAGEWTRLPQRPRDGEGGAGVGGLQASQPVPGAPQGLRGWGSVGRHTGEKEDAR